jgi:tripartite-type tricarboxylate transporter receptor subunit TctC
MAIFGGRKEFMFVSAHDLCYRTQTYHMASAALTIGRTKAHARRRPRMKQALAAMLATVLLLTGAHQAQAEEWPSRPIKLIVPFAAGGTADLLGRVFAQALSESLSQQVYVENRGGAGGMTASAQVARTEPDGYTLLVSGVASHAIAPALSRKPEYDPIRQFTHIAYFGGPPIVWVVHPSLGVSDLNQLLVRIRGAGEPLSYGSPGVGTQGHLVAAYLARKLDLPLAHVAYKGANPAMFDLIGGHIKLASVTWTTALAHIQAGAVIPIAVTARRRLAGFPNVPTFAELGYPDLVATTWFSLSGPPGLPRNITERLNQEVLRAFDQPQVRAKLEQEGIDVERMDTATFARFIEEENARWAPIARSSVTRPE